MAKSTKFYCNRKVSLIQMALGVFWVSIAGCQSFDSSVVVADLDSRNENRASAPSRLHNNKGIRYLNKGKLAKAETHFRRATDSDPTSAAAHNNLGTMHLGRRDLYSAAWEFQRATDLAPRAVEPIVNLGLVFDEAERLEEAADKYMQALAIDPNHPIALGNLVRVRVKQDGDPLEINSLLKQVVFIDTRVEWVEWAQVLLTTKYRVEGMTGLEATMPSNIEELPMPSINPTIEETGNLPIPPNPSTIIPLSMNPMMMTPLVPSAPQSFESKLPPFSDVSLGSFVGPTQPAVSTAGSLQIVPNSSMQVNPITQAPYPNNSPVYWAIPQPTQGAP